MYEVELGAASVARQQVVVLAEREESLASSAWTPQRIWNQRVSDRARRVSRWEFPIDDEVSDSQQPLLQAKGDFVLG